MKQYFYISSLGNQKGPFRAEELRNENIKRDTLVWTNDMPDWMPAQEVEELRFLFEGSAGYYPHQTPQSYSQPIPEEKNENIPPMPKNWLVESILVTLIPLMICGSFLSLLGIVGIVSASKVDSQYKLGDYAQAIESAKQAKRWTMITFWITIGWVILLIIAIIVLLALGVTYGGLGDIIGNSSVYSI